MSLRLERLELGGELLTCVETNKAGCCIRYLQTCDGDDCITEAPAHPEVPGRKAKKKARKPPKQAKKARPQVSATPGDKEPWKMSKEQWEKAVDATRPETVQTLPTRGSEAEAARKIAEHERLNDDAYIYRRDLGHGIVNHKLVIAKAFAQGKKIPATVLQEYPDIAAFVESANYKRDRAKILEIKEFHAASKRKAQAEKKRKQIDMVYDTDLESSIKRILEMKPEHKTNYYLRMKSARRTYVDSTTPIRGQSYVRIDRGGRVTRYNPAGDIISSSYEEGQGSALAGDLLTCSRWIVVGKGADALIRCGTYKQTCQEGDPECAEPAAVKAKKIAAEPYGAFWFNVVKGGTKVKQIPHVIGADFERYLDADKGRSYLVFGYGLESAQKELTENLQRIREMRKEYGGGFISDSPTKQTLKLPGQPTFTYHVQPVADYEAFNKFTTGHNVKDMVISRLTPTAKVPTATKIKAGLKVKPYQDVEFTIRGGVKKTGTVTAIYDDIVYVIPDGATNSIPVQSIDKIIPTKYVGEKPVTKFEPYHFTLEEYVERTKPAAGLTKDDLKRAHKIIVEEAVRLKKDVPTEVLKDYPYLIAPAPKADNKARVLELLQSEGGKIHIDEIGRRLDMKPQEVSSALVMLELDGKAAQHAGKLFSADLAGIGAALQAASAVYSLARLAV